MMALWLFARPFRPSSIASGNPPDDANDDDDGDGVQHAHAAITADARLQGKFEIVVEL
jgi:hypothetical protein